MKKLWTNKKGVAIIESFTAGDDPTFDQILMPYDIVGSIAHARGLAHIGIITTQEEKKLVKVLNGIHAQWVRGGIHISASEEDCHTVIENILIKKLGNIGKKIHTGRSRNDQILTALRLYMKEKLDVLESTVEELIDSFKKKSNQYKDVPMPGYTHMQRAMPSSVSLWLESFSDALKDDILLIKTAEKIIDQSPLGSVVGYGENTLGLNRAFTAKLLGFSKAQRNPLYAANSRGKFEFLSLMTLQPTMMTLGKFATDALLFSTKEFGYVSLPAEFTTGSSAMPQKRNYDVLELIRAHSAEFYGQVYTIASITSALPSGYNRDFQLTKKPFVEGIENALKTIDVAKLVVAHLCFDRDILKDSCSPELYATDEAYLLVKERGISFRDAYKMIAKKYNIN